MASSRVDMHCHSTASQLAKLGIQQALGLPECATAPEEVYELAKRRGMDFVTITDHDTIDGVLELADRPDVFVSEELTVSFRNEPQAVHVLCYGISPADHDWLQSHNGDVEACAEYLHSHEIACALAHPFFAVAAPLTPRHRRRLAELFPVWETRNGSRAPELNMPAAIYIDTHGGTGIAGSDDHAGIDIGRTFTSTPRAATPEEFLAHLRVGRAEAHGDQGSAAKWAHSALALAARVVGCGDGDPDPRAVLALAERIVSDGDIRGGAKGAGLGPSDARSLLRAWLESVDLHLEMDELIELLQDEEFSHADLYRRARRAHERRLRDAVQTVVEAAKPDGDFGAATQGLFQACTAAIPYAPAAAFLAREKAKLVQRGDEPIRVGLVADGVGGMHGVTHTLEEIRQRGVPGFEVEVIGTDPNVDRRLSSVADVDIPYYADLQVGVPSLPTIVETLAEGRYELLHLCSPGPAGVGAALLARVMGLPTVGSYHTELERLHAPAQLGPAARGRNAHGPVGLLRPLQRRALPQLGLGRVAGRTRDRGAADRPLGPRRGPDPLQPAQAGAGALARRAERALRRAPDQGEGRRPARRRLPRGSPARPAPAPRAGRRRPRAAAPLGAARRHRGLPRLAGRRRPRSRVRQRRRVPVRQPHGHLRPGDPRGPGLGPAGGGG